MASTPAQRSAEARRTRALRSQRLAEWRTRLGLLLLAGVFLWGSYVGMRAFEHALANRRRAIEQRRSTVAPPPAVDTTAPAPPARP